MTPPAGLFRPLQGPEALLYAAASEPSVRLFLGSSAVEHSTVNRMVAGSNPARGAKNINDIGIFSNIPTRRLVVGATYGATWEVIRYAHGIHESAYRESVLIRSAAEAKIREADRLECEAWNAITW